MTLHFARNIRTSRKLVMSAVSRHPSTTAVVLAVLFLMLFQFKFIITGDAWAESYAEYLDESLRMGWSEVFRQNWAGYFTIIPSFLSKIYVEAGAPIGYIDYYHRATTIGFVMISIGLIAAKFNRPVIKSDYLRIGLALILLLILVDVASFSFVNIWYFGYIPLIIYCLNPEKIPIRQDVVIGLYGALVALTKPLLIIMPLLVYRMIKTRQFIGAGIILFASSIQSYQIVFNDRRGVVDGATFDLNQIFLGVFTGSGVGLLKLLGIEPSSYWFIVFANLFLGGLFILIWRIKGWMFSSVVLVLYAYLVFTFVLAPDSPIFVNTASYTTIYWDMSKSQREILINATLILLIFIAFQSGKPSIENYIGKIIGQNHKRIALLVPFILILFLGVMVYRPIDVTSSGVSLTQTEIFRDNLNSGEPTCVPVTPTPTFYPESNWFFSYGGICHARNYDTNIYKPNYNKMNVRLNGVHILLEDKGEGSLSGLLLPVYAKNIDVSSEIIIINIKTGVKHKGHVFPSRSTDNMQFVSFDMAGTPPAKKYEFIVESSSKDVFGGKFKNNLGLIFYGYFITPQ